MYELAGGLSWQEEDEAILLMEGENFSEKQPNNAYFFTNSNERVKNENV